MSAARYGVNRGGFRQCLDRWCMGGGCITATEDRAVASAFAKQHGGTLVRLLTPAESRRKAAATALRELAVSMRERATGAGRRAKDWEERGDSGSAQYELGLCVALVSAAEEAESRADALWPRKGAGR